MPGKGQRRREKNFRAAHGGETRLPPPPNQRELDALPSKLRRLIAFQNKQNSRAVAVARASSGGNPGKQGDGGAGKSEAHRDKESKKQTLEPSADAKATKVRGDDGPVADENLNVDGTKKKRKLGKAMDFRFKELDENVSVSKKQKRKKHLDEKKKKKKHKDSKTESPLDFPGREKVKFGEIADAPPKLSFPKVKSPLDVSREWLRKEAIDNYRNIKGWTSRPGLQLPTLAENTSL